MIPEINPYNNYRGDGYATKFDFDFLIDNPSQLIVQKIFVDGTIVNLVNGIDYEIKNADSTSGGYINFPLAESEHTVLKENETISLQLFLPFEQISEYGQSSLLDLNSLEFSLDYLTRLCQILKRQMERSVKASEGNDIVDIVLPPPLANNTFAWNEDASALVNYDIIGENNAFKNEMTNNFKNAKDEFDATIAINKQEILDIQGEFEYQTNEAIKEFKDEVDAKIEIVADAADRINDLDSDLAIATNAANEAISQAQKATEQADIAASKASEILNIKEELEAEIGNKADIDLSNLSEIGQSVLSAKADVDLSNLSEIGEKHFLGNSNITNCITKKPQKFNLELADGVLTLKSGSIVTVANGFEADETTPKFDEITVNADASSSSASASTKVLISYSTSSNVLIALPLANSTAGADVTATNGLAFDTTTNKISSFNSSGSLQYSDCCLPLAIVSTDSSGKYVTIDQTFDEIGYIGTTGTTGSTIWLNKDVVLIIPNGRNEDGTLKNIVFTTTRTLLRNGVKGETRRSVSFYSTNAIGIGTGFMSARTYADRDTTFGYQYVEDLNKTFVTTRDYAEPLCIIADITCDANSITSFRPKTTFRALDINDKAEIASWGSVGSEKIAVATTNTHIGGNVYEAVNAWQAPADGWMVCQILSSEATRFQLSTHPLSDTVGSEKILAQMPYCPAGLGFIYSIKISKGQYFALRSFPGAFSSSVVEFIYDKGAI